MSLNPNHRRLVLAMSALVALTGAFIADNILAKPDARYKPPQLGSEVAEQGAARTVEQ